MINFFKSKGEVLNKITELDVDCWVDMVNPNEAEIDAITTKTGIDRDLLVKMLDENEH